MLAGRRDDGSKQNPSHRTGDAYRMKCGYRIVVFILIALAVPSLAGRKAKVTTGSGKKWDVLFLKMSKDTVFLKAFKPNGDMFNISGHKSKFKKLEFGDGTSLDFSLSNFPPAEDLSSRGGAPASKDTLSLKPPSSRHSVSDTFQFSNQYGAEDSPGAAALPLKQPAVKETAGAVHTTPAADTAAKRELDKAPVAGIALPAVTASVVPAAPAPDVPVKPEKRQPAPGSGGKKKGRGLLLSAQCQLPHSRAAAACIICTAKTIGRKLKLFQA
jgi:hypothetical protein